ECTRRGLYETSRARRPAQGGGREMVRREHRRPHRLDIARRRDPGRAGEDDPAGGGRPASLGTRDAGQDAGCARRRTARPGRDDQDVEDAGPSRAGADAGPAYRRNLVVAARLWPRHARRIAPREGHRLGATAPPKRRHRPMHWVNATGISAASNVETMWSTVFSSHHFATATLRGSSCPTRLV